MAQNCISTNCSPDGSVLLRLQWKRDLMFWLLKSFMVQLKKMLNTIMWYVGTKIIYICTQSRYLYYLRVGSGLKKNIYAIPGAGTFWKYLSFFICCLCVKMWIMNVQLSCADNFFLKRNKFLKKIADALQILNYTFSGNLEP